MGRPQSVRFDEIGYWSEIKLDIVKEYVKAYSTILTAQRTPSLHHVYIDAFCGAGIHLSKTTQEFVLGSPRNALLVEPPFREYYFIDLDGKKVRALRSVVGNRPDVRILEGDCNQILLQEVFPKVRYEDYRRALCLLDPYGLDLNWEVLATAGRMRTIDLFLNFPVMDMNRNTLWRNPDSVPPRGIERMNAFWGDDSWRKAAYKPTPLFTEIEEKADNKEIADAFRRRLRQSAGFARVLEPLPMRNSTGAVVYYLFFASQRQVAEDVVQDIFDKYRQRGAR
ncbi:MAG: three-Cys-motif partner protein TcmP [Planctomycetes bacterium]|nr:three-Cys-motif partner protein TcmP [Planctomycetota bacterium]